MGCSSKLHVLVAHREKARFPLAAVVGGGGGFLVRLLGWGADGGDVVLELVTDGGDTGDARVRGTADSPQLVRFLS